MSWNLVRTVFQSTPSNSCFALKSFAESSSSLISSSVHEKFSFTFLLFDAELISEELDAFLFASLHYPPSQMRDIQIGNSRVLLSPHLIRLIRMRHALASVMNIFYKELDRKNPNFGNKTTVVNSVSGWSIQWVTFLKLGFDYSILAKNGLLNTEYDGEKRKKMARRVYFQSLMLRIRFIRIIFIKFYYHILSQ